MVSTQCCWSCHHCHHLDEKGRLSLVFSTSAAWWQWGLCVKCILVPGNTSGATAGLWTVTPRAVDLEGGPLAGMDGLQGEEPFRTPGSPGDIPKWCSLNSATEVACPVERGSTEVHLMREEPQLRDQRATIRPPPTPSGGARAKVRPPGPLLGGQRLFATESTLARSSGKLVCN